jgi:hypothetical protein
LFWVQGPFFSSKKLGFSLQSPISSGRWSIKRAYASQWFLPGPAAYISLFSFSEDCMGKSMEKVLAPVLNELRLEGFLDRWERERELKKVRKNRRNLNRSIRENKAIKETLNMPQGKVRKHG